jgi:hypothetical protein
MAIPMPVYHPSYMKSIGCLGEFPAELLSRVSCSLPHFPLTRPCQGKHLAKMQTRPF